MPINSTNCRRRSRSPAASRTELPKSPPRGTDRRIRRCPTTSPPAAPHAVRGSNGANLSTGTGQLARPDRPLRTSSTRRTALHCVPPSRSFLQALVGRMSAACALAPSLACAPVAHAQNESWVLRLQAELVQIEAANPAGIGVYVRDLDSGLSASLPWTACWRTYWATPVPTQTQRPSLQGSQPACGRSQTGTGTKASATPEERIH